MPLRYPSSWKFDGFGVAMPARAVAECSELVAKIASGVDHRQFVFEAFKSAYGSQSWSSSPGWAESDLRGAMDDAKSNAALFVASFWEGIEKAKEKGYDVPTVDRVNKLLDEWDVPLVIRYPELLPREGDIVVAPAETEAEGVPSGVYRRGKELGRGGFGIVYRVTRSTKAGEFDFAMKVLDPSPFVENEERALARFAREMQALRKLQHRGIVPHIEAGIGGDRKPYILMPLIDGTDLRTAFSGATPGEVMAAFAEILLALEYAHASGVLHRDLKPSNVLVRSSDRQPIILDFGCAYLMDGATDESLTTTLVGSAPYIPSEVLLDPKHRTVGQDVYACGMLLHQVLVGHLPNPADYRPVEEFFPGCRGLDGLLQAALAPERRRITSAAEFRGRLDGIRARSDEGRAR